MRKSRLRNSLRQSINRGFGSVREPPPCSPPEHKRITNRHDFSSRSSLKGDSPRIRGRHGSDQYEVPTLSPEANLFDFLRESDSVRPRGSGSFKRRRSFEGRLQNRDFITANGNLCRNNSDNTSHHRANRPLKSEKDSTSVPSIVVDSPCSQDPPTETDCLLDLTASESIKCPAKDDKSPPDSHYIPLEPMMSTDDESPEPCLKYTGVGAKLTQSVHDSII